MFSFPPDPSHEDLRDFMDDEERREWDSGTSQQKENISKYLTAIWQSIPDPSEAQLQQLMRPEDWQVCQNAPRNRDGILNFYRRKWKKDRKAAAAAKFSERIQVKTISGGPTNPTNKPRDPDLQAHENALKRQEQERQRKFEEEYKVAENPSEYPPALVEYVEKENERRRVEAKAKNRALEEAFDNALRKQEDRARTQRELGEIKRLSKAARSDETPETRGMFSEVPPTDRGKKIGAVFVACVALTAAIIAAFQQAGVISVLLAHLILVVGWIAFVGSVFFLEHVLSLPIRKKVKVTLWAALISGLFMLGVDRLMVHLKAEQTAEAHPSPSPSPLTTPPSVTSLLTPKPTPMVSPQPSPSVTPKAIASPPLPSSLSEAPLSALAGIPFKGGGSPQRLDSIMKAAGYSGSTQMSVLIVGNDENNVNEVWVGTDPDVKAKISWRLDGGSYFNFPGGEDTARVYIRSAKDGKIDVTYRPR